MASKFFLVSVLAGILLSGAPSINANEPDPGNIVEPELEWIKRPKITHLDVHDEHELSDNVLDSGSDNSGFEWIQRPKITTVNEDDLPGNHIEGDNRPYRPGHHHHHQHKQAPAGAPKPVEDGHEHKHHHHHRHHHGHHSRRHAPAPSRKPVPPSTAPAAAPSDAKEPAISDSDFFML